MIDQPRQTDFRFKTSPIFKLKDKDQKSYMVFNLKTFFGFIPETIIIEKLHGENNKFVIKAILTPEEVKKEDEYLKKLEVEAKKHGTAKPGFQIR